MTEINVTAAYGLEARYAAMFVQTAGKFESKIQVVLSDKIVNAKSIMGIISLSIMEGDSIMIIAEGDDSEAAAKELAGVLKNKGE
jgi:phosphotransferase system HPr (HPr) family protein